MKILITGGAGFIGSNLALYFLKKKHQVTIVDNLISNVVAPERYQSRCKLLVAAIEDDPAIASNLYDFLEARGHIVDAASDGIMGLQLALTGQPTGSTPSIGNT